MPWRNDATPRNTMKPNATKVANNAAPTGVLAGQHMGGHSDVAAMKSKLGSFGLDQNYSVKMSDLANAYSDAMAMKKQMKPTSYNK